MKRERKEFVMGEAKKANAMVLGIGLQGKAVIHDLEQSGRVKKIIAADISTSHLPLYLKKMGYRKTQPLQMDVTRGSDLMAALTRFDIKVIICMLPIELALAAARVALDAGVPFVSSNYTYALETLQDEAKEKNSTILPEMGLDPGIDLILGRMAVDQLDEIHGLYSYGGGIPAPECADTSPIKYKISWIFDRVLAVYTREARLIKKGKLSIVPGENLFDPENVHQITFNGIGPVEAYPNGDAQRYVKLFGLGPNLNEMGRFALRWPGHSAFWRKMVSLGLLNDRPIKMGNKEISPRDFLAACLLPKLQYREDERDLALLKIVAWGIKDRETLKITFDMMDYRDLDSGLFAMNRTVGFTASIGAQMILSGQIAQKGVLSPVRHVPPADFIQELGTRGIHIHQKIEPMVPGAF